MDIKINFDEIDYKNDDLAFENGDLVVVDGDDCIKQQIKIGLFITIFDWFLDFTKGINYFLGFRNNEKTLQAQIKDAIKSVENVVRIGQFKFDTSDREKWKVKTIVYTPNSEIDLTSDTLLKG